MNNTHIPIENPYDWRREIDMNNKEVDNIRVAKDEAEYLSILESIGDKITFKVYSVEEIQFIITELLKEDILSFSYALREQMLYVISEACGYYDIKSNVDFNKLLEIVNFVENDLKEYINEVVN